MIPARVRYEITQFEGGWLLERVVEDHKKQKEQRASLLVVQEKSVAEREKARLEARQRNPLR